MRYGDFSQSTGIEPEYETAFTTWKRDPSPSNSSGILTAVEPIIGSALRSYGGKSATSPTLRIKARSLALDAMQGYDPAKGKLKTHLMSQLQRLQRAAGQEQQIIRIPEVVSLQRKAADEAFNDLNDTLGRPPSDNEIADRLGVSTKRLAYIRKGVKPLTEHQVSQVENPAVEDRAHGAWVQFVHDSLAPRDQFILERVMGLHGNRKHTPSEVAKGLKVSVSAVSQRMAKIQQQLDQRDELGVL